MTRSCSVYFTVPRAEIKLQSTELEPRLLKNNHISRGILKAHSKQTSPLILVPEQRVQASPELQIKVMIKPRAGVFSVGSHNLFNMCGCERRGE